MPPDQAKRPNRLTARKSPAHHLAQRTSHQERDPKQALPQVVNGIELAVVGILDQACEPSEMRTLDPFDLE